MPWLLCVKFFLLTGSLIIILTLLQDTLFRVQHAEQNDNTNVETIFSKAVKLKELKSNERQRTDKKRTIKLNVSQLKLRQLKKSVISERNENIRRMFYDRTQRVESICKQYQSYLTKPDFFLPKAYSLEPLEKLAICRTAKHGSTTWAKNFIHIYLGKEEFRKGPKVYQRRLEEIEQKAYTREQKVEVLKSLKSPSHEYLSFFVCRNPIEKLVSVYNYMKVLKNRPDFGEGRHPSWEKYIRSVVSEDNYLGLTRPLYLTCNLCKNQYDAIIMMETYTEDSRKLLTECGLGWVVPSHTNDHGAASIQDHNLHRMFSNLPARIISSLVDKYFLDFKFCGYDETLQSLQDLIEEKE